MDSVEALGPNGPLVKTLPGFMPRAAQQALAQAIEHTLAERTTFIAESGTGTGKTFAYLVPALLSGCKVLISSGTKNLQDQLFRRDLPRVRDALGIPVAVALLKGRANYLCRYRLRQAEVNGRFDTRAQAAEFVRIGEWAGVTKTGDIAQAAGVPEDSEIWAEVTSTTDNCLGSRCQDYDTCFVNRARREALAADVLVVNHHLFFADLALREEGFGQLLPGVDAVIFDEAHQLPEVAGNFLGIALSGHQLASLCRDATVEEVKEKSGIAELAPAIAATEKAVADLRLSLTRAPQRLPWQQLDDNRAFHAALSELRAKLERLSMLLTAAAAKGEGLASCARRAETLIDRLVIVGDGPPPDHVAWVETSGRSFTLHQTPLNIAPAVRARMQGEAADGKLKPKAWIFTSATLAVGKSFAHFQERMGLEDAETGLWDSPFDYARQALMYLPPGLPLPSAPDYTERVIELALPVLQASRGRAFLLFTSHRALKLAHTLLANRLPYPLLVQGSMPRAQLLDEFRARANAVLLGTGSFWEGVDVRGETLSCVIIDKLPFAAPDDPVLAARGAALEELGRNPFMEQQLPEAVIALKQGAGRLIRHGDDYGVLMLCDPRLTTKSYGKIFLNSLPPMARTRDAADVARFFQELVRPVATVL